MENEAFLGKIQSDKGTLPNCVEAAFGYVPYFFAIFPVALSKIIV